MFWTRLFSSIFILAAVVILGIVGGLPLLLGLFVISVIGLFELYRIKDIHLKPLGIMCYIIAAIFYASLYFTDGLVFSSVLAICSMLALIFVYVIAYPKYDFSQIATAFFGLFYVAVMLSFVYVMRIIDEKGAYLIWLIFISAWGSDTLAYCVGSLIGKHKMTPELSPKKSVEGAIGGVVCTVILGVIYALIFKKELSVEFANPVLAVAIIVFVSSIASIFGDLAASAIKRNHEIKDYGTLIPGHGGVLDRFDSIIVTAPVVFIMMVILMSFGL